MSVEKNKEIAVQVLRDISNGNSDAVINALAESAIWWVAGNIPQFSGAKNKQEFSALLVNSNLIFSKGLNITIANVVAEGDFVAVEGNSDAELPTGNRYRNQYHWLFEIRDGKVQTAKEYLDTLLMMETIQSMTP